MGNYINQTDLESAISPRSVVMIYDDNQDGVADTVPLAFNIDRAEGMVDSFLITENKLPLPAATVPAGSVSSTVDRLVRNAALAFLVVYSFQRHVEYAKIYGKSLERWEKDALELCERIKSATQELPDTKAAQKPRNIGGFVLDDGPRMFIANTDGTSNGGDL